MLRIIGFYTSFGAAVFAQQQAVPRAAFEVASIKPSQDPDQSTDQLLGDSARLARHLS